MTRYDEICAAFRENLPRKLALSKAIEELPLRLRNAVEAELNPPRGATVFLSGMYERDIPFVYLARPIRDEHGKEKYIPCSPEDALFRDNDGVLHFGLGLAIEAPSMGPYMIHWLVALEGITQDVFTLKIVGAPGTIETKVGDCGSYTIAAKKIGEWMLAYQSDAFAALGDKAPAGFRGV